MHALETMSRLNDEHHEREIENNRRLDRERDSAEQAELEDHFRNFRDMFSYAA